MRFQVGLYAALALLVGCGGDNAAPDISPVEKGEHGGRVITGQVYTIAFQPESTYVGLAGAAITILQTSSDSGDSGGVHPDSMVPLMFRGHLSPSADSGWIDTLPSDTTYRPPVDTMPTDTLTPPRWTCGPNSHQVATAVTDADGRFSVSGLGAGTYEVIMVPPPGYSSNFYCGVDLRSRQSAEVQIYTWSVTDTTRALD